MSEQGAKRSTTGLKPLSDFKVANAVPVLVMLNNLTIEFDGYSNSLTSFFTLDTTRGEWVGWCPFGDQHGKADSFNMNNETGRFFCMTEKHKPAKDRQHSGGNVLTFASKYRKEGLRDAGLWLEGLAGSTVKDVPPEGHEVIALDARKILAVLASEEEESALSERDDAFRLAYTLATSTFLSSLLTGSDNRIALAKRIADDIVAMA